MCSILRASARRILPRGLRIRRSIRSRQRCAPMPPLLRNTQALPSGLLTSLPFHVLITLPIDPTLAGMARYQQAAWLALQQPIMVLPSVNSLQALRQLSPSQAREPYIAFGNPLLIGPRRVDKSAWSKQRCTQPVAMRMAQVRGIAARGVSLRAIDLAQLRAQEPLPETADELCAVAGALGALGQQDE